MGIKKSEILYAIADCLIKESDLEISKENVTLENKLKEFGLDSMQGVMLIMEMEEKYGISIDDDEMEGLETIGDVVGIVQTKLSDLDEKVT